MHVYLVVLEHFVCTTICMHMYIGLMKYEISNLLLLFFNYIFIIGLKIIGNGNILS